MGFTESDRAVSNSHPKFTQLSRYFVLLPNGCLFKTRHPMRLRK